jgi:Zinc carboxypeptidase
MKKLILCLLSFLSLSLFAKVELSTKAEKTKWLETGRADEVTQLCENFQKTYPTLVRCKAYGTTPEGRTLRYLSVGNKNGEAIWIQAGIHAGEIDGKDATFYLLKELLAGKHDPLILKKLHIVFIPIVNLDGHERFGAWNRPNQVGPKEMGWRVTSQNLNMNRDFLKVETPEMEALLKLWHSIDPILSLDLHVTNGAQFQPEVGLIIYPHSGFGSSKLHHFGKKYETDMMEKLLEKKHLALPFYPAFLQEDKPSSGIARNVSTPKFAHGYWYNANRIGMLVESHSWKDYATRVKVHYSTVLSSLELAVVDAKKWREAANEADAIDYSKELTVPLTYRNTDKFTTLNFPGYEYKRYKSKISNKDVIEYNPQKTENWAIPFYEELVPDLSITPPKLGYYIPMSELRWIERKLKAHSIQYKVITLKASEKVQVFYSEKFEFAPKPFEGLLGLKVTGEWKEQELKTSKRMAFVPIKQKRARLVLHLFEPQSVDSLLGWGFFNRFFEQKEYMEEYVTEKVAHEMLKDPKIKSEFEERLKDEKFKENPAARFEFFYRKHPSWDDRMAVYPVVKK